MMARHNRKLAGLAFTLLVGFFAPGMMGCSGSLQTQKDAQERKPNFIIVFADDLGYNDLGCYGSKTIRTPRIDRMAAEGIRMTAFYTQTVCGPARGALLTGRYPPRIGGGWLTRSGEITIAELLKEAGYATGCIGKWDISQRRYQPGLLPNDQGFDYYFGTLGGNGAGIIDIYRNRDSLYRTSDMSSLTSTYTEEALQFIEKNQDQPFLLYLAHTMGHIMIDASPRFKGRSEGELYGDVIEELDWNVGRVLDLLEKLELDRHTYVAFFSDNGPWSSREDMYRKSHGNQLATGSAYPLRSSKGSAYEGGVRVPAVFRAPGRIPAGRVSDEMMATLDILPTLARLAGVPVPGDRVLDGYDCTDLLLGRRQDGPRDVYFYHIRGELQAVRKGDWKFVLPNPKMKFDYVKDPGRPVPELYNLRLDISETRNQADRYPEVLAEMRALADTAPNEPENN